VRLPAADGVAVAAAVGKEVVDSAGITTLMLCAALTSTVFWMVFAWYVKIPSSSTHALIGGLVGAVLHTYTDGPILGYVFGALLISAGLSGLTGIAERIELKGPWRWIGGFASAVFGGLVGNQGGIRSAAMLGFDLSKESFVATATVIALVVDGARMPIYFVTEHERMFMEWPIILIATIGVIIGTVAGSSLLERIAERMFKRVVSALVFGLGIYMLVRPA
jgi:uncharacterized membrane protein YfcA